ncbi:hypothetical protein [Sandaracinus amylolyticus]|nr:hypothetical protein [Sandaracinus amylolyticus]
MNVRMIVPLLVLVPFALFSGMVVLEEGYLGFFSVAREEPWGMQMLIDLAICFVLVLRGLAKDARERGLALWPWVIGTVLFGSIAPLGYLVYRELVARPAPLAHAVAQK